MRNDNQSKRPGGGVFPTIPPTVVFVDRKLEIHENQSMNIHGFARFIFCIMNNVNSEELGRVVASAIASYLQPNNQRQGRTEGNSTSNSTTSIATWGQVRTAQLYYIFIISLH